MACQELFITASIAVFTINAHGCFHYRYFALTLSVPFNTTTIPHTNPLPLGAELKKCKLSQLPLGAKLPPGPKLETASSGANTLATFLKYPCLGPQMTTSAIFPMGQKQLQARALAASTLIRVDSNKEGSVHASQVSGVCS